MMRIRNLLVLGLLVAGPWLSGIPGQAQDANHGSASSGEPEQRQLLLAASPLAEQSQDTEGGFGSAAKSIESRLEESIIELNKLREQVAMEKVPLSQKLNNLEGELVKVRLEHQQTSRLLDSRALDLSNLSQEQIYEAQAGLIAAALDRLNDALGGTSFDGTASDYTGSIHHGTFVLVGPAAIFQSDDGRSIGTAEQRLGSLEPTVIAFGNPADANAAANVVSGSAGLFPLDPTLGNAHKIEATKETLVEHIKKGGSVMVPIIALAAAALLVAIYKWLTMAFLRKPSARRISAILNAVAEHDEKVAMEQAKTVGGPVGKMLVAGVEHLSEPRELIEEIMYEVVQTTRLRLQRLLPFVALSASSAPLLGLLGTVTGIIATFKLMTVYGSGDVKTLSAGISEALITTEYGLYVAIPSLLMYAFLSRKARGVIDEMEKTAAAFLNQVSKTPWRQDDDNGPFGTLTADRVQELLMNVASHARDTRAGLTRRYSEDHVGAFMNPRVVSVSRTATVGQAIDRARSAEIGDDIDCIFVVDEAGKYVGHVLIRHLLTRPEKTCVDSLTDTTTVFVRLDTHKKELEDIFTKHDLLCMPVLDNEGRLVGRIARNGGGNGK